MTAELIEAMQTLDASILRAARGAPTFLVDVFRAFTVIGAGWGLIALVPFAIRPSTRRATLWLGAAIALTSACVSLVKWLVGRARPCDALGWCVPLVTSPGGGSFPSGHAAGSFAFAAYVGLRAPRLAVPAIAYASLVAWSRCVLGVHYPSDVLAGAFLGAAIGAAIAHYARAHAPVIGSETPPTEGAQPP